MNITVTFGSVDGRCMTVVETPDSGVFTGALMVVNNCLNRDYADY
ncbi:hypothetical protein [Prolixibacter denitrificans]|uniref:Uncharacterized protein n=1 Tax=Prolixibacter denitrificans TaxID=1541063 RepID=A0A2P8C6B4_9BACT|nr:hypothetical protein [Prolixibacter denitrificans]PSK80509.1 hypothetical protein CLV93_11539 [Prolixibacter denitrificans]